MQQRVKSGFLREGSEDGGYLVARVDWHDPNAVRRYGDIVIKSLRPFGGKYLGRGEPVETLEGSDAPPRLAVVRFPTHDALDRVDGWRALTNG